MTKAKTKFTMFGYVMLFALLIWGNSMRVSAESFGRVLFISSYSYAWDSVRLQMEGIEQGLDDRIVIDYEFMDAKRVYDEVTEQQFYESLAYRTSKVEPYDAVIAGDDVALLFVMEHRDELFKDIPIIFEGINDAEYARELSKDPLITGIVEKLYIEENIDFGLKINPKAQNVVMILDNSVSGLAEKKHFYACADKYPELEFSEINASELSTWDLQLALQHVGKDSILIYLMIPKDASGKIYSHGEAIKLVVENAEVPVICMEDAMLGYGFLGGNMMSMVQSGKLAAEMVTDYLAGKTAGVLPETIDSPNSTYVDEVVMKKFNISKSVLPAGTVLVNHQKNFFERNREAIAPGIVIIIASITITLWVLYDNFRRKGLLLELEDAKNIMESASQHDFLTSLPNRSKFMADLEELIAQKRPCTLMMLDIDDFKKINDTYGHNGGDDALRQLATRLKGLGSQILTPYRYAGDEFIVIIRSNQSKIISKAAVECTQLFDKQFILDGTKATIHGSIGISTYPQDTDDLEQLIAHADDAMYSVKKNGKNAYAYYKKED